MLGIISGGMQSFFKLLKV